MWSSDGKRLFYVRPPATGNRASIIYSVDVLRSDTSFDFGKEQRLSSGSHSLRPGPSWVPTRI